MIADDLRHGHVIRVPGYRRPQVITGVLEGRYARQYVLVQPDGREDQISGRVRHTITVEHKASVRVSWPAWRDHLDRALCWLGVLEYDAPSGMFCAEADEPVRVVAQ